ncbi:AAA family ATPase [Paenibacillus senegalensis]|uniref:AAA family ATPase n=1 Tax=Paenibacillus senegalensis TaxID=1465766 RepID=UPI0002886DEC|nr:AAA family ATPase [Paenibacillus senegalensis]
MKFILLIGPQAVGKMSVGQELAELTGFKLFHNHMSIDFVTALFSYGSPEGKRLIQRIRRAVFEEAAQSDLPGLIFTFVWAFDRPEDWEYVEEISSLFEKEGNEVYWVELEADLSIRLERNQTPNRLAHKPSKRNLEWSERDLQDTMKKYRLNSRPGEIQKELYLRIDTSELEARATAEQIIAAFGFARQETGKREEL